MAIEIVSFPMKNGGSFHSYVNVYQRVAGWFISWQIPMKNMVDSTKKKGGIPEWLVYHEKSIYKRMIYNGKSYENG